MTQHESTDVLVSVADAALTAAEADAAKPNSSLIFREEWRPTPRMRSQSPRPPISGTRSFFETVKERVVDVGSEISRIISPGPEQRGPVVQPLVRSASAPISGLPAAAPQPGGREAASSVSGLAATSPPSPPASALASPSAQTRPNFEEGAVGELLRENRADYDEVVNHAFPRAMGEGTASLDGFRYYMLQDRLYLDMCGRLKMMSAAYTRDLNATKAFERRHRSSIGYVDNVEETCVTMLGISKSTIRDSETKRSSAINKSEHHYMTTLQTHDPELGYYVVLLPCILTYWAIANRLMNDPKTVKNVVYHSAWTEVNDDTSSVYKYIKFINENMKQTKGRSFDAWSTIFGIACMLEKAMFETGLNPPAPYKIIDDGIYPINVASGGFVLAIRDVADVLPQFLTDTKCCVVGIKESGGSGEKWQISLTPSGYTIQDIGTKLYVASKEKNDTSRMLHATAEPYYWWINPVKTKLGERSSRYQIYDTANLRFTLHADIEMAASNESNCISVIAQENTQSSSQMWTFDDGVERPAETTETLPLDSQIASAPAPTNTEISAEQFSAKLNLLMAIQHDREMQDLRQDVTRNIENLGMKIMSEVERRASQHDYGLEVLKEDTRKSVAAFRADVDEQMKCLGAMHRREMDAFRQEVGKIVSGEMQAFKAEMLAEMTKLRDQLDSRTLDPEEDENGKDDEMDGKDLWRRLPFSQFGELASEQARAGTASRLVRETSHDSSPGSFVTNRGNRRYILSMSRKHDEPACHWERLTRRIFHPSDLEAQPIKLGGRGSLARYIIRVRMEDSSWVVSDIGDGRECGTRRGDRQFSVLVGRASGLTWVSCRGRFRAYSIDEDLVSVSDSESREHPDATYIAMFVYEGDEYITDVKEGQNAVIRQL